VAVPLLIPLSTLLSLTALFRLTNADIAICRVFFGAGDGSWSTGEAEPWKFAYSYGTLPGLAIGIGGLAVGVASLAWRRLRAYRDAGFFLAAVLAIGPGLLVNGLFKPYWSRPRPRQIVEFGGDQQFVHVWGWTSERMCKSFPSGHASMGFYLMAPAFLLYRRRRRLALGFVALGLTWGSVLGVARVAQGGHFPSDVLWSAGMTYLSALALCYLFNLGKSGVSRARTDQPARFEPIVIGPKTARDIPPAADKPLPAEEEADRRKAA
jgi:membrane-associated PAP2 superfamily phosphatase